MLETLFEIGSCSLLCCPASSAGRRDGDCGSAVPSDVAHVSVHT